MIAKKMVVNRMTQPALKINDLIASVDDKRILKGLTIEVKGGEIHAIMGPNGAGKSTLSATLMGHPNYIVNSGTIMLNGENLLQMSTTERARNGLFLAMQYPSEITGVTNADFIRSAINAKRGSGNEISLIKFIREMEKAMNFLDIDESFAQRYVNEGFSGGEKKRNEILQMMLLEPQFVILDEIDSGLDIDALRIVSTGVNELRSPDRGFLIITHYQRLLDYIEPDNVHIMMQGRIVSSGGPELAQKVEADGYEWLREELGLKEEIDSWK